MRSNVFKPIQMYWDCATVVSPVAPQRTDTQQQGLVPSKLSAIWRDGAPTQHDGPVHVSMNDYLIHRVRDIPRVAWAGLRLRHRWPETEGALGLWFAVLGGGRRQVSVSVWRSQDDLRPFVGSPAHLRIMASIATPVRCSPTPGHRNDSTVP